MRCGGGDGESERAAAPQAWNTGRKTMLAAACNVCNVLDAGASPGGVAAMDPAGVAASLDTPQLEPRGGRGGR
eukprot:9667380-Alexandrium_andersonii.AAC.3